MKMTAMITGAALMLFAAQTLSAGQISVTGEAVVNVKPDKITVALGIETWDGDIMTAKQKNNDILRKAVAAIKETGVQEKDIQTDNISIEPRYKDDYSKNKFIGYFVRNAFTVTLSDPGKVEGLVTGMLQSGVTHIHKIDFQTSELKKYREQARDLALKAAREKAEKMAASLGQSIGDPTQISESHSGYPCWYYSSWGCGWGYGRGQGMSQNVTQEAPGSDGGVSDTVALGKISIRAGVSVSFELKK
jgi:uncharacterized protein YggE